MRYRMILTLIRLGPQRARRLIAHLPNFFRLFWRLLKDSRVSLASKLPLILVLAYVLVPVDFLPDILPALGQVDDLLIVYLGLRAFVRLCPREVVREHVRAIAAGG